MDAALELVAHALQLRVDIRYIIAAERRSQPKRRFCDSHSECAVCDEQVLRRQASERTDSITRQFTEISMHASM